MCTAATPGGRSGNRRQTPPSLNLTSPKRKRGTQPRNHEWSVADPLAYYITWSCYGTRLHGDPRGTVDRNHNTPNTPFLAEDRTRNVHASERMSGPPYVLSNPARIVVEEVIRKHCQIREWSLLTVNVRTTHVHVVVNCHMRATPETAMEQFKAWATRRLREAGHATSEQKLRTEHGSTRWIDTSSSLAKAIDYVKHQQ